MSTFANAANKLGAPSKKSVFERQKEEAEAKKAREKAETEAAYEDFVKSFEGDGDAPPQVPRSGHGSTGGGHGPGKRHFTNSGLKSGPGSLGPAPGVPQSGPGRGGPAFGKKRPFDDFAGRRDRDRERDRDRIFAYDERRRSEDREMFDQAERESKDEEEMGAARPTLHLSSLPPGTSPAVVKALLTPSPLVVESVRILPAPTADRKALSAIVTLAAETPSSDIDTVVSHLQNRYLGFGFNLSLSRHLSSAALSGAGAINAPGANANNLPFGARPIPQHTSLSRAPPPGQPGRFAPPSSYTSSTPYGPRSQSQVIVQAPADLKQLKLIHKTLEALLTYGPEFEALLMSRPPIQQNPQWAWLWNPRSQGGVYYRWRLWEILTDSDRRRGQRVGYGMKPSGEAFFEGQSQWIAPEETLKFEYTTNLEEFVSDEDYNSSDEEDDEQGRGGLARRHNDHNIAGPDNAMDTNDGLGYLNPLAKAKLVHLISRLPTSNARLRKGDVARITGFAIEHAGAGADEVATLVTRNVVQPFSQRNRQKQRSENESGDSENEGNIDADATKDVSPSSLIGLYIISDILSASASAGVRHAWRYRSLFETSLRRQKVFERLGRYEKEMKWGKLKAEKWKRSVQVLLGLWEGWSVWTGEVQEEFVNGFLNPPALVGERMEEEEEGGKEEMERTRFKATTKWKSVDASAAEGGGRKVGSEGVDGQAMVDDDDDVDGMLMDEEEVVGEDIDGVPIADSSDEEMVDAPTDATKEPLGSGPPPPPPPPPEERKNEPPPPVSMGRQRPRAMDMFADEESD